ncbi:MAG: hypothetical protein JNK65_08895, partial [Deltaproteobacteria bacterium]|nr:hypothetical protein [Deltaproteobacteria bacterium]
MLSLRFSSQSEDSLLLRLQTESHSITEAQKSVDVAVTSFMAGLHDIKPVLGMLGGSLAYQGIRSIA